MAIKDNSKDLVARLSTRFDRFKANSETLHEALTRIGVLVSAKAKMNVRRQGMIDTGRLINSLRYEFYTTNEAQGIQLGSFGVPYAAIHEFGGPFTDQMRRAMFASLARRGRKQKGKAKGVIRENYVRARPYLRPALLSARPFTLSVLREALNLRSR